MLSLAHHIFEKKTEYQDSKALFEEHQGILKQLEAKKQKKILLEKNQRR